jgi:hypothetical protein
MGTKIMAKIGDKILDPFEVKSIVLDEVSKFIELYKSLQKKQLMHNQF